MVCENMANAARVHAVERGEVVSDHTLIAFGGAAPLHAARVAEKLGVARVLVPPNAGVGSAVGFLAAPISYELVKSRHMRLDDFDFAGASALLAEMAQGCARAGRAGRARRAGHRAAARLHALCRAGARDHGAAAGARSDRGRCRGAARDLRARILGAVPPPDPGRRDRGAELVGADLDRRRSARARSRRRAEQRAPSPDGSRAFFDGRAGGTIDVPLYRRERMEAGARVPGPAIIAEDETSTFVTASFDARIDAAGLYRDGAQGRMTERMSQSNRWPIDLQIMWNRLIAVVEEQAQTLMRTAFSPDRARVRRPLGRRVRPQGPHAGAGGHRHAGPRQLDGGIGEALHPPLPARDDEAGRRLHHQRSVDGHRPPQRLRHHDARVQRKGKLVALFSCTSHLMDIGGIGFGPDATDVFMEGLYIPMLKLIDQGTVNETLMAMIRANTRLPIDTEGDTYSLAACNDVGAEAPRRDDGRVRHRLARCARRAHLRALARGRAGGDRQAAARAPGTTR